MKSNHLLFIIITAVSIYFLIAACNEHPTASETSSSEVSPKLEKPDNSTPSQFPQIQSKNIAVTTFEVKDSTGRLQGWGYDLYVDKKKMIHQPIIPAIPGNNPFKTEQDAYKTGQLAADKMKTTGSLPTLSVKELDSLGITK